MRSLRLLLLTILFTALVSNARGAGTGPSELRLIRESAGYIVHCQLPNGLIAQTAEEQVRAVPYFANIACIGLLRAYQVTNDKRYLDSVLRYVDWYAAHVNPDGTMYDWGGCRTKPTSTGNYDSSDSYPATFVSLCYETYCVTRDRRWLRSKFPCVLRCFSGISLTMQADGLTFAKPDFKVKYLMDNIEVHIGIRSAIKIAEVLKERMKVDEWNGLLRKNGFGLLKMWQPKDRAFSMCIFENGSLNPGFAAWYPDGMANAMALAFFLEKGDPAAVRLAERIKEKYPEVADYWRFACLWKFGFKAEAEKVRKGMEASASTSVDKGLLIRALVPGKDDYFFFESGFSSLPDESL